MTKAELGNIDMGTVISAFPAVGDWYAVVKKRKESDSIKAWMERIVCWKLVLLKDGSSRLRAVGSEGREVYSDESEVCYRFVSGDDRVSNGESWRDIYSRCEPMIPGFYEITDLSVVGFTGN